MMGTVQNYSLLCCLALFFLLPQHLMADSSATSSSHLRAPESAAPQFANPGPDSAGQTGSPAELNDIHDIYGPIPLPDPPPYWQYGGGALLIAAAGVLLIMLFRFRKNRDHSTEINPAVRAHADLRKAETIWGENGDLLDYCDTVSTILRTYVEQRCGYRISSRTTMESLNELEKQGEQNLFSDSDRLDLLRRCFTRCDMVKFARFSPDQNEVEHLGELAASFISKTTVTTVKQNGDS